MENKRNLQEELLGKIVTIFIPGTDSYKFNVYLHWFEYTIWRKSLEGKRKWIKIGAPLPVPEYEGQIHSIKPEFINEVPEELKRFIEISKNPIAFFIRDFSYLDR